MRLTETIKARELTSQLSILILNLFVFSFSQSVEKAMDRIVEEQTKMVDLMRHRAIMPSIQHKTIKKIEFAESTSADQGAELFSDFAKRGDEKNAAKLWIHLSLGDIAGGVPTYFAIGVIRLGIGRPPPLGFGIGTVLFEGASWWKDGSGNASGYLPLTLHFVPYANWSRRGFPVPIVYSYFSVNTWSAMTNTSGCAFNNSPANYLKFGVGISCVSVGLEAGFISWKEDQHEHYKSVVYFGACLSLGLWKGCM